MPQQAVETWQQRLYPFGEMYWQMQCAMRDSLLDMTDDELRRVIADTEQPGETNVWHATYDAAPIVRKEARSILFDRGRRAQEVHHG